MHRRKPFIVYLYCLYFAISKQFPSTTSQFVTEPRSLFLESSLWNATPYMFYPLQTFQGESFFFSFEKRNVIFHLFFKRKKVVFIDLWKQFPMLLFLRLFNTTKNGKWLLKIKWITLDLLMKKEFYWFKTKITSRVKETSFTEPDATEATSTLELRQKVKRDKITALYRHLNVTVDPCLADIDRFMIKKKSKTGNTDLFFLDGNKHWQSFTNKRTVNFKRQRHGEKNLVD